MSGGKDIGLEVETQEQGRARKQAEVHRLEASRRRIQDPRPVISSTKQVYDRSSVLMTWIRRIWKKKSCDRYWKRDFWMGLTCTT